MRLARGWAIAGLGISLAWSLITTPPARAQPPVWIVHGPRGEIVLFGSLHMLPRGVDWRSATLETALGRARELWFELPIDEATDREALRLMDKRGRLPAGQTLWDILTDDQIQHVRNAAALADVPAGQLAPLKPWLADVTLALAQDAKAGANVDYGVESRIQNAAPPTARRRALERVEQQVGYLAASDEAEQIAGLDDTALEIITDPDHYARTLGEWLAGDLAGLRRDGLDRQRSVTPAAYRRLVVERNRRWARLLASKARDPGVTVLVVGAAHLIGPDGLPALLRARGLAVEGP